MLRWSIVALLAWSAGAQEPEAAADPLVTAIQLPVTAHALRTQGVPDEDVRVALRSSRDKGLKPSETEEVLKEADAAVKAHGPVDNFGAFVQARLDEGLRGKDLAAAIRAEHEAHGKGKGGEGGKPEDAGKPEDKGKPEGAGKPEDKGKPADKGAGAGTHSRPGADKPTPAGGGGEKTRPTGEPAEKPATEKPGTKTRPQ